MHFFNTVPASSAQRGRRRLGGKKENKYFRKVEKLKRTIPNWTSLFSSAADDTRAEQWVRLSVLAAPLSEEYAWAIPDSRALNILASFGPLVEIGAGKGYWGYLLTKQGVDVVCIDKYVPEATWMEVKSGDAKYLRKKICKGRNLFLCYPDEGETVGLQCLEHFRGEYIIHVGELMATGCASGPPQTPWGRTSTSEFQVALAEDFHNVLTVQLPSFPFGRDYLSVWKRTEYVDIDEEDYSRSLSFLNPRSEDDEENAEEGADCWADIPEDEQITDFAAPAFQKLLFV